VLQSLIIIYNTSVINLCVQLLIQIRGNVLLVHLEFVIQTPTVLRLHLTCVPVTRPAATGVNAIKDTSEMDLIAQVSYRCLLLSSG